MIAGMPRSSPRTKSTQANFRAQRAEEAWNGALELLRELCQQPGYLGPDIGACEDIARWLGFARQLIGDEASRHIRRRQASRAVLQALSKAVAEQR
jgi:hypothetical protein